MKSLLNYARKIRDGVLFSETFENDNFMTAQVWVALQGQGLNTGQQAKAGIKSLQLAGAGTPIIWKSISDTNVEFEVAEVWFYDTMDTSLPGPFFKVKLQDGKFFQTGVRNSVSTTHYCTNPAATFTEDTFAVTAVPRSLGWHRFRFRIRSFTLLVSIDTTEFPAYTVTASSHFTDLKLQADVFGSAFEGFGNFDEVRIYRNDAVTLSGIVGRRVNFRDMTESMNQFDMDLLTDNVQFNLGLATLEMYPTKYALQISQKILSTSSPDEYTKLAMRTPYLDISLGDWYLFEEIEFGNRRLTTFDLTPRSLSTRNESANGRTEVLTYGWKDRLQFTVSGLEGRAYWHQAQNWYEHARKGEPFGLLIQENDHAFHRVRTLARAGSHTLECFLNYTGGGGDVEAGRYLVLEKVDRSARQVVKVTTVTPNASGPILTLEDPLRFDIEVYDIVRSVYFLWALEMEGQDLGMNLANPRKERYNWVQNVREYVP